MAAKKEAIPSQDIEKDVEEVVEAKEGPTIDMAKLREEIKAELKAEIAAEMAKGNEAVAEPKTTKVTTVESEEELKYLNERVPILIPRGPNDPATYTVTHNGVSYQIKRGDTVMIPRKVKNIIDRSMRQQAMAIAFEDENAFDPSVYNN